MSNCNIGIIGGGAAGMAAAVFAARAGGNVTLIERNEKLGKKVYITGKGRCNMTNVAAGQEFLMNVPRNPRFLYSALDFFDNQSLIDFIESQGVPTKVERGGRVFPESDHASDVTRAFERELRRLSVKLMFDARVTGVEFDDDKQLWRVSVPGGNMEFKALIVCMGGASYPSTGSDGFGARLMEKLGLAVEPLRPALVPIETAETWPGELTGISLKNVNLRLGEGKKPAFSRAGRDAVHALRHKRPAGAVCLKLYERTARREQAVHRLKARTERGRACAQTGARNRDRGAQTAEEYAGGAYAARDGSCYG